MIIPEGLGPCDKPFRGRPGRLVYVSNKIAPDSIKKSFNE